MSRRGKTIREWQKELPPDILAKFIANRNLEGGWRGNNKRFDTIGEMIQKAFSWTNTPEGHRYWYRVRCGEYTPVTNVILDDHIF